MKYDVVCLNNTAQDKAVELSIGFARDKRSPGVVSQL
jgi:hypothetical protein